MLELTIFLIFFRFFHPFSFSQIWFEIKFDKRNSWNAFPGFFSCSFNKCIEFKINVQSNKEETRSVTNHTTFLPNLKIDHVPQELGFDISKKSLLWLHFSCVCIILNETNRCPSTFFLLHVYRRKLTFSSDVFVVFDKKNDNARATLCTRILRTVIRTGAPSTILLNSFISQAFSSSALLFMGLNKLTQKRM